MTDYYIRRRIFAKLRLYNDHLFYFNQLSLNAYGALLILYGLSLIVYVLSKFELIRYTEFIPSNEFMTVYTLMICYMIFRIWKIKNYGLDLPTSDDMHDLERAVKGMNWRYRRQRRVVRAFSRSQMDMIILPWMIIILSQIYKITQNEFDFSIESVLSLVVVVALILGLLTRFRITNRTFEVLQREPHIKVRNLVVNFLLQSQLNPRNK
jgi:hypothetical protein